MSSSSENKRIYVATALTVYGIETDNCQLYICEQVVVATALTVYGIETVGFIIGIILRLPVATALTVYGIETMSDLFFRQFFTVFSCNSSYRLRYWNFSISPDWRIKQEVATALTVYGIETTNSYPWCSLRTSSCNSSYRLRYWNYKKRIALIDYPLRCYRLWYALQGVRQQRSREPMRSTHRLPEQSEGKTKVMRK